MNFGPRKIVISIAAMPGDQDLAPVDRRRRHAGQQRALVVPARQRRARSSSADQPPGRPTANPSSATASAAPDHGLGERRRRLARRAPTPPARTREPAPPPRRSARPRAGVRGPRPRGGRPAASGPQLRHLPEHRRRDGRVAATETPGGPAPRASRPGSRCSSRSRGRIPPGSSSSSPRRREKVIRGRPTRQSRPPAPRVATPIATAARAFVRLWASANGKRNSHSPSGVPIVATIDPPSRRWSVRRRRRRLRT